MIAAPACPPPTRSTLTPLPPILRAVPADTPERFRVLPTDASLEPALAVPWARGVEGVHLHNYLRTPYPAKMDVQLDFQFLNLYLMGTPQAGGGNVIHVCFFVFMMMLWIFSFHCMSGKSRVRGKSQNQNVHAC